MIYHVIANDGRATRIEADSYTLLSSGEYAFTNKTEDPGGEHKVASINAGATFAVVEDDACLGSFYPEDEDPEDEEDDVCLDCRILELLDTEEFYEAVVGVIESHCGGREEDTPPEAEPPAPVEGPVIPKVEHRKYNGEDIWGFVIPEGFVYFYSPPNASYGLQRHLEGKRWKSLPVSETTLVEDGK